MKIGYARVSSSGQHLDVQRTALTDAGCEKIYEEKVSGVAWKSVGVINGKYWEARIWYMVPENNITVDVFVLR